MVRLVLPVIRILESVGGDAVSAVLKRFATNMKADSPRRGVWVPSLRPHFC
jgi:hypothetical protein